MDVSIIEGPAAIALLGDTGFLRKWEALAATCAWTTGFQSPDFSVVWYEAYAAVAAPVLVTGRADDGTLVGLLPLAVHRETRRLCLAGDHQAEYHAWLAREADGDRFIVAALRALAKRYPRASLLFRYLPPEAPRGWIERNRGLRSRCIAYEADRPLLRLGDGSDIEQKLRKKSNKSRMNRLRDAAGGELQAAEIASQADLETTLDQIALDYDERQSGANGVAPFRDDPFKRAFYLGLFRRGLLHVFVLRAGGALISSVLSVKSGSCLSVGVFAHSPDLAEHSPGKFGMLLLARSAAQLGWECVDLTPGGAWKERFANDRDRVIELTVHFSAWRAFVVRCRERLLKMAKAILAQLGITPSDIRRKLAGVRSS